MIVRTNRLSGKGRNSYAFPFQGVRRARAGESFEMGERLQLRVYRGPTEAEFRRLAAEAARQHRGVITWDSPGDGDHDLRTAHRNRIHTVYLPSQGGVESAFCETIGELADCPWIELRIQEGTLWDYVLLKGLQLIDQFSVCPQYWDGGAIFDESLRTWQGNPETLSQLWEIPVGAVSRYLVNWGYNHDEDSDMFGLNGRAYPSDEFEYGDYQQMWDFLRVLGGESPTHQHSLVWRQP